MKTEAAPTGSIHMINARDNVSLLAAKSYMTMTPEEFRHFLMSHYTTLTSELSRSGVAYSELRPALVPQSDRHEVALLFNSDLVGSPLYGDATLSYLLPLLDDKSTLSVMAGDIGLPATATRMLAKESGLISSTQGGAWGQQFIFCVYVNNSSEAQRAHLHEAFGAFPGYLGHIPATYHSRFRTHVGDMIGTRFIKHRRIALVDHGLDDPWVSDANEIGLPFRENGMRVVSVNTMLFSPLLTYKIQAEFRPEHREDVLVSLNAISPTPIPLDGLELLLPEAKFGYLHDAKGGLLRAAGLDTHTRHELAAIIREQIERDYLYRLQWNVDGSVQFTIMLELPRPDSHPVRLALGLKYVPTAKSLSLVTLT